MKHLKKFNESDSYIVLPVPGPGTLQVPAQKRYRPIKYGHKDNALFISSSGKVISFETADNGVDISDISKIEDIINFLMDEKDKLMLI